MPYFTTEIINFLANLRENNNKNWFDQNRKHYIKHVREPFKEFVDNLIFRLQDIDPNIDISYKDAIFRINRDLRFNRDKPPYKPWVSASIKDGGKKSSNPGFYVRITPDTIVLGGGIYQLSSKKLLELRRYISKNRDQFMKLLEEKHFKKKFGEIHGEKHKRIPKEFKDIAENFPLIANKQFHYTTELDPTLIDKDDLLDILMDYYSAAKEVHHLLKKGVNPDTLEK